jgi:hypothetical protein
LHSLNTDSEGNWDESSQPRTNLFIKGFPPYIIWRLVSKQEIQGSSSRTLDGSFIKELEGVILGLIGTQTSKFKRKEVSFSVCDSKSKKEYSYKFFDASRTIVALCVLLDGKSHPRNHLEVTLSSEKDLMLKFFEVSPTKTTPHRVYGDPSKTVDELRNQGFPRQTDDSQRGVSINVERKSVYGTLQESYQLKRFEQSMEDRVGRSNIPEKFRKKLYESDDYQCCNCGQTYPVEYLAPDHRIPSIVQNDELDEDNFIEKLQTLCVRCNQVKREACKKCPYEHNCDKCEWAFPEKYAITKRNFDSLFSSASDKGIGVNEYIQKLLYKEKQSK